MPDKKQVTRKLSAILSADVKGYSVLMADDEVHTIETLKAYRHIISDLVSKHSGRVVDSPGDNILAEFRSSVDAVECAVKIQKALDKENSKYVDDKKVQFRIGVNIGDVIQDGDRIYGNGVNVAARIEALAESGGICISRNAYSHVRDKLELGYEYLGEHSVKNIKRPIRVYKVLMAPGDAGKLIGDVPKPVTKKWIWATAVLAAIVITIAVSLVYQKMTEPEFEAAKVEQMAYPLPKKPSIAVLAFDNMTGDPTQEYFSDGIAEEIITVLSKADELFVIARNSSFSYKGKPVKVQQVSKELGVRYILEGSVRKSGNKVRVTAQLIDAINGQHLWAKNYDRDFDNIFEIQDEISMQVVTSLRVELTEGEQARMFHKEDIHPEVYKKQLQAISLFREGTRESLMRQGQLAQEIIDIAPKSDIGYRGLSWHHWNLAMIGESQGENSKKALKLAHKALSIDDSNGLSHALLGSVYLTMKKYEKAIASGNRSIELQPNGAQVHLVFGNTLVYTGRFDEAIVYLKKAIRLNPLPPSFYYLHLGKCYMFKEQFGEALSEFKKSVQRAPGDPITHMYLAINYIYLDRTEEARASAAKAIEIYPNLSVSFISKISRFKNQAHTQYVIDAMRKAGFPEYPPGKEPPEKPSIAVLPFDNLSDDPEQGYLADGLTDELIGDLAKIDGIFVISRNSTFTYKGKDFKIPEVAKELNVRYVLEGSVQRAGNRLRIRAQLIDGKTDHHVWSESYDGDGTMDNIFKLQDEITGKIVTALAVKLTADEKNRVSDKGTDNILAYDAYLKGHALYAKYTPESVFKSLDYYKQAIEIDPDFSRAYAGLALSYFQLSSHRMGDLLGLKRYERATFKIKSRHYLNTAMKNPTWEGYRLLAYLELSLRHYDNALYAAEKAYSLAPNEDLTNIALGVVLISVGRPRDAIFYLEQSIELAPQYLDIKMTEIGEAHFLMGNYEEAISNYEQAISINPEMPVYNIILTASYALSGRKKEAIKTFQIYKDKIPERVYNSEGLYYGINYIDHENFERLLKGLRVAGFDEDPLEYFKVEIENRLGGDEIENLLKGNIITAKSGEGLYFYEDGQLEVPPFGVGGRAFNGKWWVENDMVCMQAVNLYDSTEFCGDVYRTPEKENKKYDYLLYHDNFISPFTIQELE